MFTCWNSKQNNSTVSLLLDQELVGPASDFTAQGYASAVYAVVVCPSVRPSVSLSFTHMER